MPKIVRDVLIPALCVVMLNTAIVMVVEHWKQQPKETTLHSPQFHTKQCFVNATEPREPWSPPVDGIVEVVGYGHYLVLYLSLIHI